MHLRLVFSSALLVLEVSAKLSTVVDLLYSEYRGVALSNGITQWLGMRYAAPPVGDLRFKPPQDPLHTNGVVMADQHGKYCLATGHSPTENTTSEDCLFVNVQSPSRAKPGSLPVFLYIQGGGFNLNSNANINASGLIQASGHNIVVVSFNYRVGPYGFLTDGKEIAPNNGLRDQEKVMQWVQKHISKFGGNPNHVTLGGSSAGAESVVIHLTARNGTDRGYFHAVTAESPSFATTLTVAESQYLYRHFATRLGCVGADSLACLRNKTARELQEQNFNIPLPGAANPPNYLYVPCLDGEYLTDYTYRLIQDGRFIKVPSIFGDDTNGGTKFAPRNASTLAESNSFMLDNYPFLTLRLLEKMNKMYPNPSKTCPKLGCYWRQASNTYQEVRYMCPALAMTSALANAGITNSFAYRWNVEDEAQMKAGLGVPHTSEFDAILGPEYAPSPPESYKKGGINYPASPAIQKYWTNFIQYYDPNQGGDPEVKVAEWKAWSGGAQDRLVFQTGGRTEMEPFGDRLNKRCSFWAKYGVQLRT
ncbi:carboxylesterase/lipase domain protein [Metarhizium robertsii]|uniref:Carboxylic ester hydrolase n=2 Tax=Metarhizium robertsii TaxID=568076 RepID=A0A0A1V9R0_9HYPO|nr:carboxylesterase/lipase domain protein [Metarhizium robertsii]